MPKSRYIKETSWGFGVFEYNTMIREFLTYEQAYAYLNYLTEGKEYDI